MAQPLELLRKKYMDNKTIVLQQDIVANSSFYVTTSL